MFQFGGILDETLMGVEIAVFFARGAFGGSAHVTRLDLARSEESIASWTFLLGPADTLDLFVGIGFFFHW